MYQIDLLKGEGRPVRSEPWAVALAVGPSVIPLVTLAVLVSCYVNYGIETRIGREQIVSLNSQIAAKADLKAKRDQALARIDSAAKCESEIASAMRLHMPWSDILNDIAANAPQGKVVVYSMDARRDNVLSAAQTGSATFTLTIGTYDLGNPGDNAMKQFVDALRASKVMGPRITDVSPGPSKSGSYGGRNVPMAETVFRLKSGQ